MSAVSFTIYKLQVSEKLFNEYCEQIINKYNNDLSEDNKFVELSNLDDAVFREITNYKAYYAKNRTTPEWGNILNRLVSDLPHFENMTHSFVLFLECQNNLFAITGGKGYLVLPAYKDYNFGIELLSRILDPNESVIKETSDRYLSGNRASGQNQFLGLVTLNSESGITNFFQEINVFFTKEKVEELFGIRIEAGRKEYKFIARDSIKLGKSLSIGEMDSFISNICNLLNRERTSIINNFYEINSKDPVFKELNNLLEQQILTNSENPFQSNDDLSILHFQADCEQFLLVRKTNGEILQSFENHLSFSDVLTLFNEIFKDKIQQSENKSIIVDFIKKIIVTGKIEGQIALEEPLLNLLDFKVIYNGRSYWLMNGVWLYLDENFISTLDGQFVGKVTSKYNQSRPINELKQWPAELNEGQFNFSHHDIENVFVLDKILVNNIELCDLLILSESETYIVHVKDGLDRDARVLSAQIMASMTALHNAINFGDVDFFRRYYNSVVNKIKEPVGGGCESTISIAARKFQRRFSNEEDFIEWVKDSKLNHNFVFAYRPNGQDIRDPSTIPSTPAKIAMINLVDNVKRFDFNLSFLEIGKQG